MSLPAIRCTELSGHDRPRIRARAPRGAGKSAPFTITIGCFDAERAMHDVPGV